MHATPEETEQAFYAAFTNGDLNAMMKLWARSDTTTCIHPSGPRLQGLAAIEESWRYIFAGGSDRHFELRDLRVVASPDMHVHLLEEHISIPGTNFKAPPVIATNVYQRLGDGWFLALHHASVAPSTGTAAAGPAPGDTSHLH